MANVIFQRVEAEGDLDNIPQRDGQVLWTYDEDYNKIFTDVPDGSGLKRVQIGGEYGVTAQITNQGVNAEKAIKSKAIYNYLYTPETGLEDRVASQINEGILAKLAGLDNAIYWKKDYSVSDKETSYFSIFYNKAINELGREGLIIAGIRLPIPPVKGGISTIDVTYPSCLKFIGQPFSISDVHSSRPDTRNMSNIFRPIGDSRGAGLTAYCSNPSNAQSYVNGYILIAGYGHIDRTSDGRPKIGSDYLDKFIDL